MKTNRTTAPLLVFGCLIFLLATARALIETIPLLFNPLGHWPLILLAGFDVNPLRDWVLIAGAAGGAIAFYLHTRETQRVWKTLRVWAYPLSLIIVVTILYLRTLGPTVGEADTFEFQVNALRLGISHGSGYPLYLVLAKLFSLLPVGGTAAFRINLSAAAFGVTAALMVYAVARDLRASRPAAWIAALSFAASIGLWSRAVEAEVYTLHVTLVGAILWLALRSQESGVGSQESEWGRWRAEYLLAFVFGLSLTNHLTTILLAPALGIALGVVVVRRRSSVVMQFRDWVLGFGIWVVLLALGLSVYLYLPLRWPAVNNGEAMTWEMFRHFITGQEAQGALRLDAWYSDFSRYAVLGRKALDQFGWPGAIAAIIGLVSLVRKRFFAALILLAAYGAFAFFGLSFYVPDPDYSSFLLSAHFVEAVWLALGIHALVEPWERVAPTTIALIARATSVARATPIARATRSYGIIYILFLFLPAALIWTNLPKVDQSSDWREYRLGQTILSQPLKEGAAILADSELIAPLYYLQVAEGVRPDLDIVVLPTEDVYRAELDARIASGQTVYLGRYLPHLADAYYLHSVGPLTEVSTAPSALPDSLTPVGENFGDVIRLHGFRLDSAEAAADERLRITFYWQAIQPPANYRVVLRLIDSDGVPRLTGAANVPVGQMYPTAAWPLDDVVSDFESLALDPALEPGTYSLQVGLFPPFSDTGLETESGSMWRTLADVGIKPPLTEPAIRYPTRIRFGNGLWLMGYDAPESTALNAPMDVRLFWLMPRGLMGATTAEVCVGESCAEMKIDPAARGAERIFETRAVISAPEVSGRLPVWIRVKGEEAACDWLSGGQPRCVTAFIDVGGSAIPSDAINFDNQIVLDSIKIETASVARGGTAIVAAQWRGLKRMDADYTVFVHLLGPDGLVHGQVDTWPVQGTLPTSQWTINTPVTDRFEIRVPGDAPSGEYTVEVGWYLLATLERLAVIDANGVAIDDKYLVRGLTIK